MAEGITEAHATIDLGAGDLIFEQEGPLAWLTFNRPQARNAMTFDMYEGLVRACDWVEGQPEVRVLLLRGAGGRAFVSGTDISQFQSFRTEEDALSYEARISRVLERVERVRRPTIALVQGYAFGGGMAIALTCDLRLCTPDAQFGVPTARTLGNCLSIGNYARLVDLLGPSRVKEILFTARSIGAEEARQIGLANEVVAAELLEARARELATTIAGHAPLTIQVTKEAVRRIQEHRRLPKADDLVLAAYMSQDFREGVQAFLEKRSPRWQGR